MTNLQFVAIFVMLVAMDTKKGAHKVLSAWLWLVSVVAFAASIVVGVAFGQTPPGEVMIGPSVSRAVSSLNAIAVGNNKLYACDNGHPAGSNVLWRYDMTTGSYTAINTSLGLCLGVAVVDNAIDPDYGVYVADYSRNAIVRAADNVVLVQQSGTQPSGLTVFGKWLLWGSYTNRAFTTFCPKPCIPTTPSTSGDPFAGTGKWGFNGDGLPALQTWLEAPGAVGAADNGVVYLAEYGGNRVRMVLNNADHTVTTFAGTGWSGASGDGGMASNATVQPSAVDVAGNVVYISDRANCRLRLVNGLTPSSIINTVATGCSPISLAHDSQFEYVGWTDNTVRRYPLPNVVPPTSTVKPTGTPTAQPTGTGSRTPTLSPSPSPKATASPSPEGFTLTCPNGVRCECVQ